MTKLDWIVFRQLERDSASTRLGLRGLLRVGLVVLAAALLPSAVGTARTTAPPRFSARVEVARTRERAVEIEAEIAGAKQLFLVVLGAHWGWATWGEPRLVGPAGELRLTELPWKFASSGYGQTRVNANVRGDAQRINGAPVPYGIGVHDPSLVIYDLPPGYTHFRARGGLDDGGAGPVTFQVYADSPFFDPADARLWQRDTRRGTPRESFAGIEFVGGDRLPGRVVGLGSNDSALALPATPTLAVSPLADVNPPNQPPRETIHVLQRMVQRIVWEPAGSGDPACPPGSARLRNGSRIGFRSVRFDLGAITLLTSEGLREIAWTEMAELHLPHRDPWDSYFEELTVLSPGLTSPLVHLETDGGMIATASMQRLHYLPPWHHDAEPQLWYLGVQPAWATEVLWLSESRLVARRQFSPELVPLACRNARWIEATGTGVMAGWTPQVNRNVQGLPLSSGGRMFSWGFGVHAPSRLVFRLPTLATAFHTQVGLDHLVADGGCVQARVLLDGASVRTLWASPLLVGSARIFESDALPLDVGGDDSARLILEADPSHRSRPPGADPFSIRDLVDWLDPRLELDRQALRRQSDERLDRWITAWQAWQVSVDDGSLPQLVNHWTGGGNQPPSCRLAVVVGQRALTLTRRIELSRDRHLRIVTAQLPRDRAGGAELEVLIDDRSQYRGPIPLRRGSSGDPAEILVPLPAMETSPVTLQIRQRAGEPGTLVEWHALQLVDSP